MKDPFDPFQFQLNLGGNSQSNNKKLISVMISPSTKVQQVVYNICMHHNIGPSLVEVIADTIYAQIENQILQKQKNRSVSKSRPPGTYANKSPSTNQWKQPTQNKKSPSPYKNNKTKKFKNKFCSYLKQSPAKPVNSKTYNKTPTKNIQRNPKSSETEIFRNDQHFQSPSAINQQEEEYSFRPSCLQTMHLTNNSFQNSLQITEPSVISMSRCSYSTNYTTKNDKKKPTMSQQKIFRAKQERTVFDNLYEHSILMSMKKEVNRKKSFEKLTFKPELNPMSKKIIEKKIRKNPELSKSQNAIYLGSKVQSVETTINLKCQQKTLQRSKCKKKQNQTPEKSVSASRKTEKGMSIYDRGVLFRKKSQEKLSRMKEREFYDEIKSCSFQPTFFSRKSVNQSRIG